MLLSPSVMFFTVSFPLVSGSAELLVYYGAVAPSKHRRALLLFIFEGGLFEGGGGYLK